MVDIPTLSREYVYVPLADLDVDVSQITNGRLAFTSPGVEPVEQDWQDDTIVVDDQHELFRPDIGESLAILVGPTRGDAVTTLDLGSGDHQAWVEVEVSGSDERVVRVAGTVSISTTGGAS